MHGDFSELVRCPNGHGLDWKRFEYVTGEIGEVNYCTDCGTEMETHD